VRPYWRTVRRVVIWRSAVRTPVRPISAKTDFFFAFLGLGLPWDTLIQPFIKSNHLVTY
jgi:hypothetical protein